MEMQKRSETLNVATVMLWMNSGCNARCATCEIWREPVGTMLSASEIASYLPEWAALGVKMIELCGEPTIHPEFGQICEMLKSSGVRFSVLSNGLKLHEFAEQIAGQAVSLTVSLDGPPEVHDRVRNVPRSFERLQRGVEAVRRYSTTLPIYGRCALHRMNYRYMAETVETAQRLALTNISFFGLDSDSPAFGRERLKRAVWQERMETVAFTHQDIPELTDRIRMLGKIRASDFASGFIAESLDLLHRSLSPYQRWNDLNCRHNLRCNAPYKSVVIEPDGKVKPCWFLESYGNLKDCGSMHGLIETEKAEAIRKDSATTNNLICQRCITPRLFTDDGTSISGLSS